MAFIVEDGTGKSDATALALLAFVDNYHAERGNATWTGDDEDKEAAIIRASAYLSHSFTWQGYPLKQRAQALAWPRVDVVDGNGYSVPSDEVPIEVQQACAEVALQELVSPNSMNPTPTPSQTIKKTKAGPVEVEYDVSRTDASASRPVLLAVTDLIGGLLSNSGGSHIAGLSVRV